jgi:hypothetical protein
VATSLPEFDLLWINEIMSSNTHTRVDNYGEYEPWIELYNGGATNINLAGGGYYLSPSCSNLTNWAVTSGWIITNKSPLLVWTDNEVGQTAAGFLHAGFVLNSSSGCVVLTKVSGVNTIIVDYVAYDRIGTDRSYGSYPDGAATNRIVFYCPTPSGANNPSWATPDVFINEWMSRNSSTIADPADGDFDDWFELYNAGDSVAYLNAFGISGGISSTNSFVIPAGVQIQPRGTLMVWADNETGQNSVSNVHVNFALNGNGDAIRLLAPDGSLVDSVTFGAQRKDVGEGRWPNGSENIYEMPISTPNASNRLLAVTSFMPAPGDTNRIMLKYNTRPGRQYRLYSTRYISDAQWTVEGLDMPASGETITTNIPVSGISTTKYFRIRQVDLP